MEEKVAIETSFNFIKSFITYEPFIIFLIKIILTIIFCILGFLCFKVFYNCIKEHLKEAKVYMNQRNVASKNFKKENKNLIAPIGWVGIKPEQVDYLNELSKAYNNEKEIVKQDVLNLLKAIVTPLGAISIIWIGKFF